MAGLGTHPFCISEFYSQARKHTHQNFAPFLNILDMDIYSNPSLSAQGLGRLGKKGVRQFRFTQWYLRLISGSLLSRITPEDYMWWWKWNESQSQAYLISCNMSLASSLGSFKYIKIYNSHIWKRIWTLYILLSYTRTWSLFVVN